MKIKEGITERIRESLIAAIFYATTGTALIVLMIVFLVADVATGKEWAILILIGLGIFTLGIAVFFYRDYREEKQDAKILQEEEQQEQLTSFH